MRTAWAPQSNSCLKNHYQGSGDGGRAHALQAQGLEFEPLTHTEKQNVWAIEVIQWVRVLTTQD